MDKKDRPKPILWKIYPSGLNFSVNQKTGQFYGSCCLDIFNVLIGVFEDRESDKRSRFELSNRFGVYFCLETISYIQPHLFRLDMTPISLKLISNPLFVLFYARWYKKPLLCILF